MPIEIELPDGSIAEFPDGMQDSEIERVLAQQFGSRQPARADFSGVTSQASSTAQPAVPGGGSYAPDPGISIPGFSGGASAGQLAADNIQRQAQFDPAASRGADVANQQRAFQEAPMLARLAAGAGSRVPALARGVGQLAGLVSEEDEAAARDRNRFMEGDVAASIGQVGGDLALLAIPGGAISRGLGLGGKVAANSALGAGYAGAQPVLDGESRGINAAVGALAGAGGELAGKGLGVLARRAKDAASPTLQRALQTAKEHGIPVHLSQVSQSLPAKTAASVAKYLPFSGAGSAARRQQEAFNTAVARTFGADAKKLSDDVMQDARRKLSREFEEIYARNDVPIKPESLRRLAAVENEAAERLTQAEAEPLRKQLDNILLEVKDGVITGQKYQALRTRIMKSETPDKIGSAIKDVRKVFDEIAADAVGPEDAATLKRLRGQWANFRTAEGLLKQISGASEDIKPAALWPAIRKGSTKEMRSLARLGQVVLKDPIPDSGTPGRLAMGGLMSGGASFAGMGPAGLAGLLVGGATVGRGLNSSALARLATSAPPGSALAALSRAAPASGVVAAPLVNEKRRRNDDR